MQNLKFLLILIMIVLIFPISKSISGNSTFYNLQPICSLNSTFVDNCTQQSIKLNCYEPNQQFVQFMVFNFNSTSYLSQQLIPPNQKNFTILTTTRQIQETINLIYNWSNVIITDTVGNIAIYLQNITFQHQCSQCFPSIIQVNSSCGSDNLKNVTYSDLSNCTYPLPSDYQVSCDYCIPNFQCSQFFPATCGLDTDYRTCLNVSDNRSCYAQTGLTSDAFGGNLEDFTAVCTIGDFLPNTALMSTMTANLAISQYPYIERNTTVDMTVTVQLNGSNVLISNVQMQIGNETILFNENSAQKIYEQSIKISASGDYPFIITGRQNTTQIFQIRGVFYVRDFVDATIQLFETKDLSTKYVNNLAEVIATFQPENKQYPIEKDLAGFVDVLNTANLIAFKLAGLNQSTYYQYRDGSRVFHAPYRNGEATLKLPLELTSVWELRLLNMYASNEYKFDEFNYAKITTFDPSYSNDIKLTSGKIEKSLIVKLLVSKYDIRFWEVFKKWGVLIGIIIVAGLIGWVIFYNTGEIELVVKFGIAVLGSLPILYFILTWIWA